MQVAEAYLAKGDQARAIGEYLFARNNADYVRRAAYHRVIRADPYARIADIESAVNHLHEAIRNVFRSSLSKSRDAASCASRTYPADGRIESCTKLIEGDNISEALLAYVYRGLAYWAKSDYDRAVADYIEVEAAQMGQLKLLQRPPAPRKKIPFPNEDIQAEFRLISADLEALVRSRESWSSLRERVTERSAREPHLLPEER